MDAVKSIAGIFASLAAGGYSVSLCGFSAIDRYLNLPALPFLRAETNADIAVLARCAENLRYPGVEIADAAVDALEGTCYFSCTDRDEQKDFSPSPTYSFPLLSFGYDWHTRHFQDPRGVYPLLRDLLRKKPGEEGDAASVSFNAKAGQYRLAMDASLILSRYDFGAEISQSVCAFTTFLHSLSSQPKPESEAQRAFLCCLMVSPRPDRGLELLRRTGFLGEFWPEIACYDDVDHSKEFHPEGNVWNHTLETFRHRKPGTSGAFDLRLSLGLLLHDAGKPVSASIGNHRFDGHAELGARTAARFLERLGFDAPLVSDVSFLVKNHMLPAALKRLPVAKTGGIMDSPLFPALMELYRCDESSSFKGLDGYYENSAAYQAYLKNARNPYRSPDGKKIGLQNRRYRAR